MGQETGITCKTFANRVFKCYYYKEKEDYVRNTEKLFNKVLEEYQYKKEDLADIFTRSFSNKSYSGRNIVYANDREAFKGYSITCFNNLNNFIIKYNPSNFMDRYNYKYKIKGSIGCIVKTYNVMFSYKNYNETEKDLDFYGLNSYIYNKVKNTSNDCLIMIVPLNMFYIIKNSDADYTIKRGFLIQSKTNKIRNRGNHCYRCSNDCKAMIINGLDRLETQI